MQGQAFPPPAREPSGHPGAGEERKVSPTRPQPGLYFKDQRQMIPLCEATVSMNGSESGNGLLPFTPRPLGMHPFSLSFHGELEAEFRDRYLRRNAPYMRAAGLVAIIIWVAFGLSNLFWADGDYVQWSWGIRYGIVLPLQLAAIAAAMNPRWYRAVPTLFGLVLIAVSGGLVVINRHMPASSHIAIEIGHVMLTFMTYTFLRLRFVQALRVSAALAALMLLDAAISGLGPGRIAYDVMLLAAANGFGGFAGYAMEYYARSDFLTRRQVEMKRQLEIETANLRTAQSLARAVAHEFNNPLTIIQSVYDLHLRNGEGDSRRRESLDLIPKAIRRMNGLVGKMVRITRVESRDYLPGLQILDLHASSPEEQEQMQPGGELRDAHARE